MRADRGDATGGQAPEDQTSVTQSVSCLATVSPPEPDSLMQTP